MSQLLEKPALSDQRLRELRTLNHGSLFRLLSFVGLYALGASVAVFMASHDTWDLLPRLLVGIPAIFLAAASLHGISLFTHEAVHSVLGKSRIFNDVLGALCAWPVLQNFSAYKVLHLRHHKFLGVEGDPDHYANYSSWTWMIFIMNWLRLLIGYPVYIVMIPILGFRQGRPRDRFWIVVESLAVCALGVAVYLSPLPTTVILYGWVLPMILINSFVNVRGMSQHTLLPHPEDPVLGSRTILSNPITRYFMCNENYHLEHHLYPRVPWYHLPALHRELNNDLNARSATFIPSYLSFAWHFVISSARRSPLGRARS